MFQRVLATLCLTGLTAAALAGDARPGRFNDAGQFVPFVQTPGATEFTGSLIVRVLRDLDQPRDAAARAMLDDLNPRHNEAVDYYIVDAPTTRGAEQPGRAENALSETLMATGLFEYAVPDWMCYPAATPNDPMYPDQWHHPQMHCPEAWEYTRGDWDMVIAFTDTGVYKQHPDLAGRFVPGYDAYNDIAEVDGGSVDDLNGHGTHVAGCAGAVTDNATGVAGVNWNSKLMMIRVAIDSGGGAYLSDILEGAQWAVEHGASIVSSSYTGVENDPVETTGAYIHSLGGIYLYAADNYNQNHAGWDWQDVIVVGATDPSDNKADFSSYGVGVDVFAPGVSIGSTTRDGGYAWWSGTSMATPVTNGVVSLIWAADPTLTNLQVEQILFETCKDLGQPGNDDYYGWGRIDAGTAVQTAHDGSCIADWNKDGIVNTQDFLAYLGDWSLQCGFSGICVADLDGDDDEDSHDFILFLNAWSDGFVNGC